MESDAALEAYENLFEATKGTVAIGFIIADDDSSMRSYLKHQSPAHPKGTLPSGLPSPEWLSDPTHRTKTMAKPFFHLAALGKSESECTKLDAVRIKRWWGFMVKVHKGSDLETIKRAANAVLEHLFDNHIYCDVKWCKPLQFKLKSELRNSPSVDSAGSRERKDHPPSPERPLSPAAAASTQQSYGEPASVRKEEENKERPKGYYRSKVENGKLYKQMKKIWKKLTTEDRLKECMHPYDSQINESMNTSVAKYARKGRTYCTTMSLTNRVMISLGVQNLGYFYYWSRVFDSLSMEMSPALKHHLMQKDKKKSNKRQYESSPERKKKRAKHQFDKMKEEVEKQIKDTERGATYGSGMAVETASNLPEFVISDFERKKTLKSQYCPLVGCFGTQHSSSRSKRCVYHECKTKTELYRKMNKYLQLTYSDCFGEYISCQKYKKTKQRTHIYIFVTDI